MLVVEHLESLSEWVMLEYEHISKVWDCSVLFTNVKNKKEREVLEKLGKVEKRSVTGMKGDIIVLDLRGEEDLKTEDIGPDTMLVIGGICGNFKPQGRTWDAITSKMPEAKVRRLGKIHLTTDTAAIAVRLIQTGKKISELKFTNELEIEIEKNASVELPYGYLMLDGKPLVTPGLIELLRRELNCDSA